MCFLLVPFPSVTFSFDTFSFVFSFYFYFSFSLLELPLFFGLFTNPLVWVTFSCELGSFSPYPNIYMDVSHPSICTVSELSSGK
jgi:hypothetical protein